MSSRFMRQAFAALFAFACGLSLMRPVFAQTDTRNIHVVMRHNDPGRTGQYLNETALTTANVNSGQFGLLASLPVDGEIYAQPLYVSNLSIGGGTHDVVFVATAHNTLYAFDASGNNPTPYWQVSLGPSVPSGVIGTPNLPVEVGIISTPAIDLSTGTIYVCCKDYFNSVQRFHLHALDIFTGLDKLYNTTAPYGLTITAQVNGNGDGNDGQGHVPFRASQENQRVAVTLANGNVYLAFAGHEDYSPYHGWVLGYNATTFAQIGVHCNTPTGGAGGIWMSGEGLVVDGSGNLYYVGGNGTYNGNATGAWNGVSNLGEAVVKLGPTCNVLDWFAPQNYDYLNSIDFDLASSGAMLIPGASGSNVLLAGGKEGKIYVISPSNMTRFHAGTDQIAQEFQASGGHIHSSKAYWNGANGQTLYIWGESDRLKAFKVVNGVVQTTPTSTSTMTVYPGYANGPGMAVSANGSAAGTGILWSSLPYDGDAVHQHVGGILRALDASDVSKELWNSKMSPGDDSGVWAKWTPPVIVKGKVYQASFNKLLVYGEFPLTPPNAPIALTATPGNALVALNWQTTARASSYNVKRSLTHNGPYTQIASNVTTNYYVNSGLTNGTTYYYVVTAVNPYGESGNSNEDSAAPNSSSVGTSVGLNFVGNGSAMGANEVAGVVPVAGWNSLTGAAGSSGQISDNLGLPSGAAVTWNSVGGWAIGDGDAPGDFRMMNGYLDTTDTSTTTVSVSGLPASFQSSGYDVYVYCDGDNTTTTGNYTLGGVTIQAQDTANFNGTYTRANNSAGNYILFPNLSAGSFTLSAQADQPSGGFRAPVNGIQIVAHGATLPAPANLIAMAGNAKVTLNWDAVASATSYKVKRSATQGGPYSVIASNIMATTYIDSAVTNGTTYYYVVSAVNSASSSPNSNEASATPALPDFSLTANPANVSVVQGASNTVTISAPSIGGLSDYVTLSVSGLPTGVAAALNPVTIFTDRQSILTLTAASNAALGTKTVTVKGVSGSLTHTVAFNVNVIAPPNAGSGIFGINFQGGNGGDVTPMAANETAGVVPTSNWNNGPGVNGTLSNLHDGAGGATTVAVTWSANTTWDVGIADTPGNNRMMKGYLDVSSSVAVSGLDPSLTYKVYVYADGDGTNGRVGKYEINGETYYLSDNSNFDGATFTQVTSTNPNSPGSGNYLIFTVTGQADFTLNATAYAGNPARAPVNGIQILSQGRVVSGTVTLDSAVNPAQPLTFTFRDFTTNATLFTRTQTLTAIPGTSGGTFSLTGIPSGKYNLAIQGAINLRKVVTVNATLGNVTGVTTFLPGGDANGDNLIDVTDFGALVNAYGSLVSDPTSGYNPNADFNFDGVVDVGDFGILVNNYSSLGDP